MYKLLFRASGGQLVCEKSKIERAAAAAADQKDHPAEGGAHSKDSPANMTMASSIQGLVQKGKEWACRICTLMNEPSLSHCNLCGTIREKKEEAIGDDAIDDDDREATMDEVEKLKSKNEFLLRKMWDMRLVIRNMKDEKEKFNPNRLIEQNLDQLELLEAELENELTLVRKVKTDKLAKQLEMYEKEIKEERDKSTCIVCVDKKRAITFVPCGHFIVCADCAERTLECPLCRKGIYQRVNTFRT